MELSQNQIETLVPLGEPPASLIGPIQRELSFNLENELMRRSFLWANALVNAGLQSTIPLEPGLSHFSAGFITANAEQLSVLRMPRVERIGFGAYVLIRGEELTSRVIPIVIGDQRFPIVVNYGRLELHGGPPHPENGSGTCWVRNRANETHTWETGIVTCRHVIDGLPLGTSIDLEPSTDHSLPKSAALQTSTNSQSMHRFWKLKCRIGRIAFHSSNFKNLPPLAKLLNLKIGVVRFKEARCFAFFIFQHIRAISLVKELSLIAMEQMETVAHCFKWPDLDEGQGSIWEQFLMVKAVRKEYFRIWRKSRITSNSNSTYERTTTR